MQKFGLDSLKTEKASALELEIAKEKATSLGVAGKRLQESLDKYRRLGRYTEATADQERLIAEIAENVWTLIVQRELVGLIHENMQWVLQNYDVPTAALVKLGMIENSQPEGERA